MQNFKIKSISTSDFIVFKSVKAKLVQTMKWRSLEVSTGTILMRESYSIKKRRYIQINSGWVCHPIDASYIMLNLKEMAIYSPDYDTDGIFQK